MKINIQQELNELAYEHDIEFPDHLDSQNPKHIKLFIDICYADHNLVLSKVQSKLDHYEAATHNLSKDDIISIYKLLKQRKIHPPGTFDKMGRFYLDDGELTDVRTPSVKYPYSQMNAGRTMKFVKALAHKYKCQTVSDLRKLFIPS